MGSMQEHHQHLLAALGALGLALFVSYFNTGPIPPAATAPDRAQLKPLAEGTHTSFPSFELSTTSLEHLLTPQATSSAPTVPAPTKRPTPTTTPVTPTVHPPTSTPPVPTPTSTAPAPAPSTTPTTTTPTDRGDTTLLASIKPAAVNILCISHQPNLRSISGSGVIIDSRGIILTVAHVAQMLLLEQYLGESAITCTIRTGSPARAAYTARPLYLPGAWLKTNSTILISSQPTGTGERDYALLAIEKTVDGSPLPGAFPAISLSTATMHDDDEVALATYGAQDLTSSQVQYGLPETLATSTVKDRYTLDTDTVDVLALYGNAAAQEGSSGGAVANERGDLVGLVTTSDVNGSFTSREMRAITPSYILRSFADDTDKDFRSYFGDTSLATLVNGYAPTAAALGAYLANAIGLSQ